MTTKNHIIALMIGWVIFAGLGACVFYSSFEFVKTIGVFVGVSFLIWAVLTLFSYILFKRPDYRMPYLNQKIPKEDRLGYELCADYSTLRDAKIITVDIDPISQKKSFKKVDSLWVK